MGARSGVFGSVFKTVFDATKSKGGKHGSSTLAPLTVGGVVPTSASFAYGAAPGTNILTFDTVESGATLTVSPNDGRVAPTSNGFAVGLTATSSGSITSYTITKSLAGYAPVSVTVAVSCTAAAGDPLEQLAVGTAGTGANNVPVGFFVGLVEPFNMPIGQAIIRPGNPFGTIANNFSGRDRRKSSPTSVGALADQYWTGDNDANDGVPIASFSDVLTVAGGSLISKTRYADPTAERPFLGTRTAGSGPSYTYRPMAWACPTLLGDFAVSGPHIQETRYRTVVPAGNYDQGQNVASAIWEIPPPGGGELGDAANSEFDQTEQHILNGAASYQNNGSVTTQAYGARHDGTFCTLRKTVSASSIKMDALDDSGNLLGTTTFGPTDPDTPLLYFTCLGSFNVTNGHSSNVAFDVTQWQAGQQQTQEVSAIRISVPTGTPIYTPQVADASPITIPVGGSGSYALPSQSALWGATGLSEYVRSVSAYDTNGPGRTLDQVSPMDTQNALHTGMTWNSTTRTLSVDPTFSTTPGFAVCYVYPQPPSGGGCVAKPHRFVVNVAPKCAIPAPPNPVAGVPFSWTPARGAGSLRYWNNGNCPNIAPAAGVQNNGLSIDSLPSWATATWSAGLPTIAGTPPAGYSGVLPITFRCTNGAGISTAQTLSWTPSVIGANVTLDATDNDFTPIDKTSTASYGRTAGMYDQASTAKRLAAPAGAATAPAVSYTGGKSGAMRALVFTKAASQRLTSTDGSGSNLGALLTTSNFSTYSWYLCFSGKFAADGTIERGPAFQDTQGNGFSFRINTTGAIGISYKVANGSTVSVESATSGGGAVVNDGQSHVWEVYETGGVISVTQDGVVIATHTVTETGAVATTQMMYGASYSSAVITPLLDGELNYLDALFGSCPAAPDRLANRQLAAAKAGGVTTA